MRKKISMLVVAALATGTIFVGAGPAMAACTPEEGPCCNEGTIPALYKKLTGEEMFHCPW